MQDRAEVGLLALVVPERVLFLTEGDKFIQPGFQLVQQLRTFLKTALFSPIRIVGYADRRRIGTNGIHVGWEHNRRVEIVLER